MPRKIPFGSLAVNKLHLYLQGRFANEGVLLRITVPIRLSVCVIPSIVTPCSHRKNYWSLDTSCNTLQHKRENVCSPHHCRSPKTVSSETRFIYIICYATLFML